MPSINENDKFYGKKPAFTVDWKSRRSLIPDKMKAAIREGSAVVLVHGIGDQKIGDTLLNFCRNLYQYYVPKKDYYKSARNFLLRKEEDRKPFLRPVFSFKDKALDKAFSQWLYNYMPLNPFRKIVYKTLKFFDKDARKEKKEWIEKRKQEEFGYEYADIQILKKDTDGHLDTIVFRAYEVYWADRFKAPDWLYVWSMFGSSLIYLFKKLDIRKPFHFAGCLLLDLYLLLAFIPVSVIFLVLWGIYSINHAFGSQKNPKFFQPFAWIKQKFETYIGDISVYVESPSDAKEVRKVLQDFLAHFGGYVWDDYERKYMRRKENKEEREDFRFQSFSKSKKMDEFKYLSIIAHSFGTVVSFEVLSKFDDSPEGQEITKRIRSYICTGSPLERIRYFWGDKKTRFGSELKNNLAHHWYNFWDLADPVSTKINTYDPHPTNSICFNKFLGIVPFSHNNYLKNYLVMDRILGMSLGPDFDPFQKKTLVSETGRHSPLRLFKNPFKMAYTFSFYALIFLGLGYGGCFCLKFIVNLLSGPAQRLYHLVMNFF